MRRRTDFNREPLAAAEARGPVGLHTRNLGSAGQKKPSHSYRCPGAQSRESPHTESGRAHPAGHVSGSSEDVHVREEGGHLRTLRSLYLKVCPDCPISWSLWFVPRSMSLQYRFFCLFVFGFWGLTAISSIMASILTGD